MKRICFGAIAMIGFAALVAGCGGDGAARAAMGGPTPAVLKVTAESSRFHAPGRISAGTTTIRLVNRGPELHHVHLVRIEGGHTTRELLDRVAAGDLAPEWITYVGGPNTPAPGEESATTLDLEPGQYALLCLTLAPDGVPHLTQGVVLPITIVPGSGTRVPVENRAARPHVAHGTVREITVR